MCKGCGLDAIGLRFDNCSQVLHNEDAIKACMKEDTVCKETNIEGPVKVIEMFTGFRDSPYASGFKLTTENEV